MTWPLPSPDDQVTFLRNIQRLLAEGLFVASYEFALRHALADLAVFKGDDTGAPLDLETKDLAAKLVELYWQQCRPFQIGGVNTGVVLQQSRGRQAAIVSQIVESQKGCSGWLFRLRQAAAGSWSGLVSEVDQIVRVMPLWKLQTVGEERLDFLYDNLDRGTKITLKPGVAYCLRAFYVLLRDLVQGAWVRFVQERNANQLGNVTDLGTFLFGQERYSLEPYRSILMDVQRGRCLYCLGPLRQPSDVDHFIPWSRYSADFGHNFVLAHRSCNLAKWDYLASEDHLAAWNQRNNKHREERHSGFTDAALSSDWAASIRIAQWAYQQTEQANGQVWVKKRELRHLGPSWRECLSA